MSSKKPNLRITRRPFVDKANLMHKKDAIKPRHQGEINRLATNDSKLKLQLSKLNRAVKQKTVCSAAADSVPSRLSEANDSDCENKSRINPRQANKKKLVKTCRALTQKQTVDRVKQKGSVQTGSCKDQKQSSKYGHKDSEKESITAVDPKLKSPSKVYLESVNLNRVLKQKTKNSVAPKTVPSQLQEAIDSDCGNKVASVNASQVNKKKLKSGHILWQKQTIDKNQKCTAQVEPHKGVGQSCGYKSNFNDKASSSTDGLEFKSPSKEHLQHVSKQKIEELSAAPKIAPSQKPTDSDASQINKKKLIVKTVQTLKPTTVKDKFIEIVDCRDQKPGTSQKSGPNNKGVRFKTTRNSAEELKKVLRKRTTKNYAELSNTDSPEIQEDKEEEEVSHREHVPVYLQKVETHSKPQNDPFEFVPDSPSRKRKGKRFKEPWSPVARRKFLQRKIEDWSDSESSICNKETYDKEMHEVLKRVRQKMEKSMMQRAVIKQMANNAKHNNLKLQKPPSSVRSGVAVKAGPLQSQNKGTLNVLAQEIRSVRRRISDASIGKNFNNFNANVDDGDMFFGFADGDSDDEIARVFQVPATPGFRSDAKQTSQPPGPDRFTLLTSTPLPNSQRSLQLEKRKGGPRPQINIISNVLLTPPRASQREPPKLPSPFTSKIQAIDFEDAPAADEFFGFDDRCSEASASSPPPKQRIQHRPWRGDNLNVTRNPHWLAVKDTSLPCYNQEMILEPKLLEKPMAAKTPARVEEPNQVQSSMLDFVSTSKSSPVKQVHNSSLFDCDDFSPIKDKNKLATGNDANVKARRPNKGKRNILGTSNKNFLPVKNAAPKDQLNVENCFGFDSNDEEGEVEKENVRVTRNRAKVVYKKKEEARPMRVAMKQLKKIRDEAAEELLDRANFEGVDESLPLVVAQDTSETQLEEEPVHVGLFEDLEQVQPVHRSYEPKRRKRVRFPSVESIEEEERPRRKRKDIRTPAEEQEFDKWAAEFNAMCEEVEKHSLETDKSF